MRIFIIKELAGIDIVSMLPALLSGDLKTHSQVTYAKTKGVCITSTEILHANIDGDKGDPLPLELQVLPQHIRLLVNSVI